MVVKTEFSQQSEAFRRSRKNFEGFVSLNHITIPEGQKTKADQARMSGDACVEQAYWGSARISFGGQHQISGFYEEAHFVQVPLKSRFSPGRLPS